MTWQRVPLAVRYVLIFILLCFSLSMTYKFLTFLTGNGITARAFGAAGKAFFMILNMALKALLLTLPCLISPIAVYILICALSANHFVLRFLLGIGSIYPFYIFSTLGDGEIGFSPSGVINLIKLAFQIYFLLMLIIPDVLKVAASVVVSVIGSVFIAVFPDAPGSFDDVSAVCVLINLVYIYGNMLTILVMQFTGWLLAFLNQYFQSLRATEKE